MATRTTAPESVDADAARLAPTVEDSIKEYILLNRLAPGDPMPTETELSERLGASRSRIREAVKTLSALDIVEVRHGYGTFVGGMSLTAMVKSLAFRGMLSAQEDKHVLTELIDVRQLLETSLVPFIVGHLTPQAALSMRRLTSTMREKAERGEEFPTEDRAFHMLLMETTGNSLAVQLTGAFWDVQAIASASLDRLPDLRATADAHVAIVDAIEGGDQEHLRQAISAHYDPIRRRMTIAGVTAPAPG